MTRKRRQEARRLCRAEPLKTAMSPAAAVVRSSRVSWGDLHEGEAVHGVNLLAVLPHQPPHLGRVHLAEEGKEEGGGRGK